jgi:hypothetical protein
MRLVNNQHEVLRRLRHGVRHRLPKGILPFVAALCEALVLAEQLRVDEVNMARMQTLFIETFAVDRNHAVIREIVAGCEQLVLALQIQFWRVGEPQEHGVWPRCDAVSATEGLIDYSCNRNRFAGAGGGAQDDGLAFVIQHTLPGLAQLGEHISRRCFLKWL